MKKRTKKGARLWPSRRQWQTWTLPSKLTAVGVALAVLSVLLALGFFLLQRPSKPSSLSPDLLRRISELENELIVFKALPRREVAGTVQLYPPEPSLRAAEIAQRLPAGLGPYVEALRHIAMLDLDEARVRVDARVSLEKATSAKATDLARLTRLQGQLEMYAGNYGRAIAFLRSALKLAPDDWLTVNELASALMYSGAYAKAENLFFRTIALLKSLPDPNHSALAATLHGLGNLAYYEGDYDLGLARFSEALELLEGVNGSRNRERAYLQTDLGMTLYDQSQYQDAKKSMSQGLETAKSLTPGDPVLLAVCLSHLGLVTQRLESFEEAEGLYREGLRVLTAADLSEHSLAAMLWNNLGAIEYRQGDLIAAKISYEQAVRLWKMRLGPSHPEVARGLNNLANVLNREEEFQEALPLFREALEIWKKNDLQHHSYYSVGMTNLGTTYSRTGELQAAFDTLGKALRGFEENPEIGPGHFFTTKALEALAETYAADGDPASARVCLERALEVRNVLLGEDNRDTVAVRKKLEELEQERPTSESEEQGALCRQTQIATVG